MFLSFIQDALQTPTPSLDPPGDAFNLRSDASKRSLRPPYILLFPKSFTHSLLSPRSHGITQLIFLMYSYLVRKQVVACLLFGDFSVVKAGSGSGVLVQIDIRDNI